MVLFNNSIGCCGGENLNLSEEKRLKILFAIGVCIFNVIIYFLVFAFDVENDTPKEKVGFVTTGDFNEKGWSESNFNGIKKACENLNLELLVRDNIPEKSGQCYPIVKELIDEGANIIFLMSFNYVTEVRPLMDQYPNVSFISTSPLEKSKNLTSCFVKMYQGRYMAGVLAGMKTNSNVIGYVAAMPNSQVYRGINAFALGVQRFNPDAKVLVMWTGAWQDDETEMKHAETLITKYNADVLTYHQNADATGKVAEKYGVDFIAYNAVLEGYSEHYLASVICYWELFYEDILKKHMKGELASIKNNWIGAQQGAIVLSNFSSAVTPEMQNILNAIHDELAYANNLVFDNEIYDNQGNLRCEKHQVISDKELLENIDWLVKGVEVVE